MTSSARAAPIRRLRCWIAPAPGMRRAHSKHLEIQRHRETVGPIALTNQQPEPRPVGRKYRPQLRLTRHPAGDTCRPIPRSNRRCEVSAPSFVAGAGAEGVKPQMSVTTTNATTTTPTRLLRGARETYAYRRV